MAQPNVPRSEHAALGDGSPPPNGTRGTQNIGGVGKFPTPPTWLWVPAALVGLLMLLPPTYLVIRSLDTPANFLSIVFTANNGSILLRTGLLVLVVTILSAILGVSMAWLTTRSNLPMRQWFGVLGALPLVIPSYVFAFLFIIVAGPNGMIQDALQPLGVERIPSIYGFPGASISLTLLSFPYVFLPARAALYRIDPSLEEAARSLGYSPVQSFFRVTLPLIRPAVIAGSLLVALYTLSDFGAVSMFRYQTFTWAIFIQYETAFDRSGAAALSLVLISVALIILVMETSFRSQGSYHRITPGTQRKPSTISLGQWRWPAFAYAAVVTMVSLGIPIAVLIYWAIRGFLAGEPFDMLIPNTINTLYISALAAAAAAFAGVPIAILAVRYPSRVTSLIEKLTYLGFALPGIAVALAFVFFGTRTMSFLYQSPAMLVLAYLVLFLPASMGSTRASLKQVSPGLEEAARSLGKNSFNAFRLVTLPLLSRGIAAGTALVFLLTMKELPATLILSPPGFGTLATSVWSAASEAFFARAAVPALLLILLAGIPMAVLVHRENRQRVD